MSAEGLEQEGKVVKKQQKENVMRYQCSSFSYTSAHDANRDMNTCGRGRPWAS